MLLCTVVYISCYSDAIYMQMYYTLVLVDLQAEGRNCERRNTHFTRVWKFSLIQSRNRNDCVEENFQNKFFNTLEMDLEPEHVKTSVSLRLLTN